MGCMVMVLVLAKAPAGIETVNKPSADVTEPPVVPITCETDGPFGMPLSVVSGSGETFSTSGIGSSPLSPHDCMPSTMAMPTQGNRSFMDILAVNVFIRTQGLR